MEKQQLRQQQAQPNLKEDRQSKTPMDQNWNNDDDSLNSESQDQKQQYQETKNVVCEKNGNEQKKSNQNKAQSPKNIKDLVIIQHNVDINYLILLIVLNSHGLFKPFQISQLKEGKVHLAGKQSKIIVEAVDEKEGAEAIQKISEYIDKISVLKLSIKGEAAFAIPKFKKLKNHLRENKIVFFSAKGKQGRQLFMGGEMKPTQLRAKSQTITDIKFISFFLRSYVNKRSYKLIVDTVLNHESTQQAFHKFNLVQYTEVEHFNKAKELKIIAGYLSKKEHSVYQYEKFMMKEIQKYYVLTFCFVSQEKYLQKIKCDRITFKFVREKRFKRSYLYVIGLKQDFLVKHQEIKSEISKIGDKIIGVRLFKYISPGLKDFEFEKQLYYFYYFPKERAYSTVVVAFKKEGNVFDWKIVYDQAIVILKRNFAI